MTRIAPRPIVDSGLVARRRPLGERRNGRIVDSMDATWIVKIAKGANIADALRSLSELVGGSTEKVRRILNKGIALWSRDKYKDRDSTTPALDLLNALVDGNVQLDTSALLKTFGKVAMAKWVEEQNAIAQAFLDTVKDLPEVKGFCETYNAAVDRPALEEDADDQDDDD
jgi:hypothetical protein